MTVDDFNKLLKPDRYQVFLFACPAMLPFSFSAHCWFVINRKGNVSRVEVFWLPRLRWPLKWGHVHHDFYPLTQGVEVLPFSRTHFWRGVQLLGSVEGGEGSLAQRMAECVASSDGGYPFVSRYRLVGPNSNTYAQWVLNRFPESGLRLPWNAFGKEYVRHSA